MEKFKDFIYIKGAREHNLKNIDVIIPRNKLVVITGLSGSGKSTLAFDTIYAEGQRRYVESLSSYARQFLDRMEKPDVEYIEGLSPAISIDQKGVSKNPRSTVGTTTEIYDYLRLLFSRIGEPHCPKCGRKISKSSLDEIVDKVMDLGEGTKIIILAPVVRGKKGQYKKLFEELKRKGFVRVNIDGEIYDLDEEIEIERYKIHEIDVIVDRLIIDKKERSIISDSIETALSLADRVVKIQIKDGETFIFSEKFTCPYCNISLPDITPRLFSFNSPYGACPECGGLGFKMEVDPKLLVPDEDKTIREGAILPIGKLKGKYYTHLLESLARVYKFSLDIPFKDLDEKVKNIIFYGSNERVKFSYSSTRENWSYYSTFEGIINNLMRRYKETKSESSREEIEKYMINKTCHICGGKRLKKEALSILIRGKSIADIASMSIKEALTFFDKLKLTSYEEKIASVIIKEIKSRLEFLQNVGLEYLTLDRNSSTLSGGEAQRIRLATQIGSKLTGVIYILDEPSIGLHPRDDERLLDTLKSLRDLGNTVIVVEHDEATIRAADYIIDLGPGAGVDGGEIVAAGPLKDIEKNPKSLTGQYLTGKKEIKIPKNRRKGNGKYLEFLEVSQFNLKNINVRIPLGTFTCITGVSGSGKSTLLKEVIYKALMRKLHKSPVIPGKFREIKGLSYIDKVIIIDQSPIGRTPRSNPATYTGVFDHIRRLFSELPDSKMKGFKPGRFSFNVRGGRCEACQGAGQIKIEMFFLPDVYVECEVCKGKRYNRETLDVKYKGKNISDVLEMTVDEAYKFFKNIPTIERKLKLLKGVGLGYIKLGQSAVTLSGGEAERIKLSRELSKKSTGKTLYLLDEPTTGLHFHDINQLLDVLQRLVDKGNTVLVIEHNLDVIKTADYIIDLGPEGGDEGGYIVAEGTPEEISEIESSYTGEFLREILGRERLARGA